jgi:hypothetical protein
MAGHGACVEIRYGGGNLGTRGIAFFFRTHECNGLCQKLGLTPFPRNESDYKLVGASPSSSLHHTNSDTLASSDSDLGEFLLSPLERAPVWPATIS